MTKTVQLVSVTLASFFVVAFQLQLLPYFSGLFLDERLFRLTIYQGYRLLAIGLTLIVLASQRQILGRVFPVLVVCVLAAGLALIQPMDNISRNFVTATIFIASVAVLAIASAPVALLRFSASATVVSAAICLLDILFREGFTSVVGRAAGLSVNPNAAAAGLLLGAASSYWAVPQRLRSYFLLTVGAAIFVTLSRSMLLAAFMICTGVGADLLWTRLRSPGPYPRMRWLGSALFGLGLVVWIVAALLSNDRFSLAARLSYQRIGTAPTAFEEAQLSIAHAQPGVVAGAGASEGYRNDVIDEIGRRVETEGDVNSISARGLLMERAFLSYQTGPFFGQGLAAAYALQPHNTFLLFAVAFGPLGWLVPIAFLGLTLYWVRSIQQLPLFLATLTVMMTSHDILLVPGLFAPIAIGIAGLNACRYRADESPDVPSAIKCTAATAPVIFALGGISVAGIGYQSATIVPDLLLLLVFGVITLWSAAVWLWSEKLMYQHQNAL